MPGVVAEMSLYENFVLMCRLENRPPKDYFEMALLLLLFEIWPVGADSYDGFYSVNGLK